jgi:hypothetical protein
MWEEIKVDDQYKRKDTGTISTVTDKTSNSVELFTKASSDKGVDSKNWWEGSKFLKFFEKV